MVAQTECPHWQPAVVAAIYNEMREAFAMVTAFHGTVPTYTGSHWTWSYASRERRPSDFFDRPRAAQMANQCLYYNPEVQLAAFALPNFVRRVLAGDNPFARFDDRHQEQLRSGSSD
jgi:spermidine synthase